MRRIGLIVLAAIFLTSFAYAVEPVAETANNKAEGANNAWKRPEIVDNNADDNNLVDLPQRFNPGEIVLPVKEEILPPGIAKRDDGDIPGKGKHLGWEKGKHKGWEKTAQDERLAAVNAALDKLDTTIEELELGEKLKDWLNQKPSFGITEEGGIDGYRQSIKNWLDTCPEAGLSDVIKEITASL